MNRQADLVSEKASIFPNFHVGFASGRKLLASLGTQLKHKRVRSRKSSRARHICPPPGEHAIPHRQSAWIFTRSLV